MKTNRTLKRTALVALMLSTLTPQLSTLFAQGTAFTYQGRLNVSGAPATGTYDLVFTIYDLPTGPGAFANQTNSAVAVSNGLFTAALDLGPGIFTGPERWLEIAVRTNGGGSYSNLVPRQKITATPYAITAGNLSGTISAGQLSGAIPLAQLPAAVVTNNQSGVNFTGIFSGNGAGLSNVTAVASNTWRLDGNAVTTAGTHFLGTTDNQPLELKVNGLRALRLEPTPTDANHAGIVNVVGGSPANFVASGVVGATIGGGGAVNYFFSAGTNRVTADFGTIGGGYQNASSGDYAMVGGGHRNTSSGNSATVGGGAQNTSSAIFATVGGGLLNTSSGNFAAVGGGHENTSSGNSATVGGGYQNTSSGVSATVGGGDRNTSSGPSATVGGGTGNTASGPASFVGGGGYDGPITFGNQADGPASVIGGGIANTTAGLESAVLGGRDNHATNNYAMIPGGAFNTAGGQFSFAAGYQAQALHDGSFVWADSTDADFASTASNQFIIRASGGVGIGTTAPNSTLHVQGSGNRAAISAYSPTINSALYGENTSGVGFGVSGRTTGSGYAVYGDNANAAGWAGYFNGNVRVTGTVNPPSDRHVKRDFETVNAREVLEKVAALSIQTWAYTNDTAAARHLGPVAQDFKAAFGLGADDKHIATVDADGVALAAIQGLNEKLEVRSEKAEVRTRELEQRLEQKETEVTELNQKLTEELKQKATEITELKQTVNELKRQDAENAELNARLTNLEKLIMNLNSKGN